MKKLLKVNRVLLVLIILGANYSCKIDDGPEITPLPKTNIIEVASSNADLSTLVSAWQRADLTVTFQGNGPFTILAPSNAAFSSFLGSAGFSTIDDVPVATLRQILLNHVILGLWNESTLTTLQKNYFVTQAEGPTSESKLSIYFDATDNITFNGLSTVSQADVLASNGLIYVVSAVIDLPTLDTFISTDDTFKDFDTALDIVSPLSSVPNMLSEENSGPFTVFAPTADAFDALLSTDDNWSFISDIDETLLTSIVEHHILNGNILSADLTPDQMLPTIEGDSITPYSINGELEIRDGAGNEGITIAVSDIQALNGVIHIIPNQVLLPDTTN